MAKSGPVIDQSEYQITRFVKTNACHCTVLYLLLFQSPYLIFCQPHPSPYKKTAKMVTAMAQTIKKFHKIFGD